MKDKIIKIYKYLRQFLFSKEERARISDCYAYLRQLESEFMIRDGSKQFCLDVAICRKYLIDIYPAFYDDFDKHDLDIDMSNHILYKRYTEDSFNTCKKIL